jgi:hypothetical protein
VVDRSLRIWCAFAALTLVVGGVAYARLPASSPQNAPRPGPVPAPHLSLQRQRDLAV